MVCTLLQDLSSLRISLLSFPFLLPFLLPFSFLPFFLLAIFFCFCLLFSFPYIISDFLPQGFWIKEKCHTHTPQPLFLLSLYMKWILCESQSWIVLLSNGNRISSRLQGHPAYLTSLLLAPEDWQAILAFIKGKELYNFLCDLARRDVSVCCNTQCIKLLPVIQSAQWRNGI